MKVFVIKNEDNLYVSSDLEKEFFVERPLSRRFETQEDAQEYLEEIESQSDSELFVIKLKVRSK